MPKNEITLLNECVAQEDSYKNCTHQKIADTLHDIIESDNNAITIGLEGEWGTGKSTVINLLENKFDSKKNNKTLFFKFDAWCHDGDPLRITFLSCLINKIKKDLSNHSQKSDLETKLTSLYTEVTGKVKKTKSNNIKSSTLFGKLLATSIVLVPIGSALFSKTYDSGPRFIPFEILKDLISSERSFNYESYIESFSLYPTLSSLFLFAPIIFIISWILIGERLDPKHNKWEFISSQSEEIVEQNIIEMGDKTSFEFESAFTQIIDSVVGDDKPFSKLICVIDNMDRISDEHAKNIWSTLQVFITNNHPKSNSVWFIIPFDESAFKKIWPSTQPDNDFISNSFTEKCFQLVIDVPTPITSNWIHYLTEMSNNAFKQWNEPNLAELFIKQYKDYFSAVEHSPTPRSINNTINQVQALLIRFIDEKYITINAITIYSLLRRTKNKQEIKNLILYPQSSTVNTSILKRVKAYERELSSILFHIPYKDGLELLLNSEIENIIHSNDAQEHMKLASLQRDYGDSFWQAWDYYYQKLDYKGTSEDVKKSQTFLHLTSTYLGQFKDQEPLLSYINMLANSFIHDLKIIFESNDYKQVYDYINNFNKFIPINDDDTIDAIKKEISNFISRYLNISEIQGLNPLFTFSENKKDDLDSIKKSLDLLNIEALVCDKINGRKEFDLWCNQQDIEDIVIPKVLPNKTAFGDIVQSVFSNNYPDEKTIKKICGMAEANPMWDGWEYAIKYMCDWARKPVSISQQSAYKNRSNLRMTDKSSAFYTIIQILNSSSTNDVKNSIADLISDERFTSGLNFEFSENNNNQSLAKLILPLIENGKFTPQGEIKNMIAKLYGKNDPTCTNEV